MLAGGVSVIVRFGPSTAMITLVDALTWPSVAVKVTWYSPGVSGANVNADPVLLVGVALPSSLATVQVS